MPEGSFFLSRFSSENKMVREQLFSASDLEKARATAACLNGPWIDEGFDGSSAMERREIINPFSGDTIAVVAMGNEETVGRAVASAKKASKGSWAALDGAARAVLLRKLADSIEERAIEFALLESLDVGKPIGHTLTDDVPATVAVLRWNASLAESAYDLMPTRRNGAFAQIVREPHGVVGVILPWNYPLTTLALKIGPALAAGNTVVCKPSDDTPLTTLRLAQLAVEVGFPPGVIVAVPGTGPVAGKAIGLHPEVAAINFTGSTKTGREFLRYAADSNLKEVSLECGGKNPAIILPDVAMFDEISELIATGFMMNSGQLCSSISRVLAPKASEEFLRVALEKRMAEWPAGDQLNSATRIGPLVSETHTKKVNGAIDGERLRNNDVISSSAEVYGRSSRLVMPTVFFNVAEDSPAWREEIFGPVLSVRFYDELDTAIASANDTDYGLSAYVFGNSSKTVQRVAAQLDAGVVAINAFCEGDLTTPFGGFKTSGFGGKDKGIHALDQYSRIKTIWWQT
jgi:4-(gamma-glutamylamino)butanal dehydrogenase